MKTHGTLSLMQSAGKILPFFYLRVFSILLLVLVILIAFAKSSIAQTRTGRIEVPAKKTFRLDQDSIVLDELVMGDSAKLELTHPTNYIKANKITIGSGCQIIGIGAPGATGKAGKSFNTPMGLCKAGLNGEPGSLGSNGEPGKDLKIDVAQLDIHGVLSIELQGGNGGDGGTGGKGSHGGKTTVHCTGNGGNGGSGGNGGNGGKGGTLSLSVQSYEPAVLVTKVNLTNRGGYRGLGGEGGKGGARGSGPSEGKSKIGLTGKAGADGQYGKDSRPLFYSIVKNAGGRVEKALTSAHGQ